MAICIAKSYLYGYQWTQLPGKYTCMSSYRLYLWLASTLERQKWHIAIPNLQATVLHSVATHWNRIFYRIFLRVIIYEFSLRILMNYMENVAGMLAHVQTVDIRCCSHFSSACERGQARKGGEHLSTLLLWKQKAITWCKFCIAAWISEISLQLVK